MSLGDVTSYFVALVAIAVAPGPMLLLLLTRAASNDVKGAIGFALGAALGSLTIITAVCLGMSAWMAEAPQVLSFSKYLMLAYIAWIAWGMWKSGFDMNAPVGMQRSGFILSIGAGYTTCILSPYMLVLFPLVLPELIAINVIKMPDFLIITFTTFAAEATAAGLIIGLAAQLRRLFQSERSMRLFKRSLALILMIGGGWMAFV
ncbi:MAG: LysE family translocator [Devosiaceae bacterium]